MKINHIRVSVEAEERERKKEDMVNSHIPMCLNIPFRYECVCAGSANVFQRFCTCFIGSSFHCAHRYGPLKAPKWTGISVSPKAKKRFGYNICAFLHAIWPVVWSALNARHARHAFEAEEPIRLFSDWRIRSPSYGNCNRFSIRKWHSTLFHSVSAVSVLFYSNNSDINRAQSINWVEVDDWMEKIVIANREKLESEWFVLWIWFTTHSPPSLSISFSAFSDAHFFALETNKRRLTLMVDDAMCKCFRN